MGVLNVTPDSFSDGGLFVDPERALDQARRMTEEGADLIDIGGESTRPGAASVSEREELRRVLPVIRLLRRKLPVPISIDTTKAAVAAAALDAGAEIVNDVSAGSGDREMIPLIARTGAGIVLMHRRGTPRTMQRQPRYRDVVAEVRRTLAERIEIALAAGIRRESIAVDPGIGFGKTVDHNLALLAGIQELVGLGVPVVVGVSRKSFLGEILGVAVQDRVEGTLAASLIAVAGGARVIRVHDVLPTVRALRVAEAIWSAGRE